ncbi:paraquat-inducible protein B [Sulfitobacter sp. SK012]|uniref:PqiB family protein n=1 Tax=Sulfitobacter sp. SK012 TaxID=1389005 RepID=UPI000E0A3372|nr:MlaD family protein [Sulfitobacter sp. SK012]AXI48319.1 paraquat-inducible protein B [Sulfitobacter sp. SK012]
MSDTPPEVHIEQRRKGGFSGASVIWLIPLFALAVALAVAWKTFNDLGPLIVVEFVSGAGIEAGQTELKYRDITVGKVEKLNFTENLDRVAAHIRVDKEIGPFIDNGSVFWIVQPEVSARGITGLSTVLSGVYIEGSWDSEVGPSAETFVGASHPPLITPGQSGLQIAFRTASGGTLTDNAPILFKGIEVGKLGRAQIASNGSFAIAEALINDDHRNLINSNTRFWDTSGFSVSIGPSGAEIDFSSIATLVGGGITFDTFVSGGERVSDGTVFEIFDSKEDARSSLFNASEVDPLRLNVVFDDNLAGLAVGASVELSGLRIGDVEALVGLVDYDQFGDSRVRLNATLAIQPARLGLPGETTPEKALALLQERVADGLRARLASASLLTGGLKIELVLVDDAPPARMEVVGDELPVIPTTQSSTSDAAATVEGVFSRLNKLPIEELLESAISLMNSADAFVSDENLRETPGDVRTLLGDLSGLVNSEDVQNVPVALNATLMRVEALVAELEEQQLVAKLTTALDSAATAADAISSSVEGVPELVEEIQAIAAKAESLEFDELFNELTALVKSADNIIGTDDAIALPGALKGALDEMNATLGELRAGGAVDNVNQTLASARNAADSIAISARDLPDVVERLTKLFAQASRTIEGYDQGQTLGREAKTTMQEIQKAADALAKLARTIERKPNSLLLGR